MVEFRRWMAASLGGVVLASLVACGSDGEGSSGEAERLTEDKAETAVLSDDNVGPSFRRSESDDDEDDSPGCLADLENASGDDPPVEVEREWEADSEMGFPAVSSQVASYDSVGDASDAFDKAREAFSDCTSVDERDGDGIHTQLTISTDDEKAAKDSDEQLNVRATGSLSGEGLEFPFVLDFAASRVDNHVTVVAVVDLAEEPSISIDAMVQVAVARLQAVLDDEDPSDELIAADVGEGDDSAEDTNDEGEGFEQLPLDGGTYTWASGVTMAFSVQRVEPWGSKDDFCGDGSCGIANPDDTRFVLKYEVSVPDTLSAPFDPSSCPGDLHVISGNDDEALSGVAGDFSKSLDGKIFPGQTKFGVEEYYVEKAYAKEDFYIESTCGDTDYSGESAYFVGPIAKTA